MENGISVYYDEEGDFLEITFGDISDCYFDNSGNGIFKIINKSTGDIKGFAIHNFKFRSKSLQETKLNFPFKFKVTQ
ncbi:MAG: hypothetical protein AABX96_01855 [Nanoarchaeota archaeon]